MNNNIPYSILIKGIGPVGGERSDIDADQLVRALVKQLEAGGARIEHASLNAGGDVVHLAGKKEQHPEALAEGVTLEEVMGSLNSLHSKVDAAWAGKAPPQAPKPPRGKKEGAGGPEKPLAPGGAQTGGAAASAPKPNDTTMQGTDPNANGADNAGTTTTETQPPADTGAAASEGAAETGAGETGTGAAEGSDAAAAE